MQSYDLFMLVVMAGAIFFGIWKGLAWQIASVAAIFVSYFVAMTFRSQLAGLISAEPPWDHFLAMFILFIGTSMAVWILFGFVRSSIEKMHLKSFDRQAGGALGAVKGALLCIIVTLFAVSLLGEETRQAICSSKSGGYIARALTHLDGVVPQEIAQYVDPYIEKFNDVMDEHQLNPQLDYVNQNDPGQFWQQQPQANGQQPMWGNTAPAGTPNERLGQLQQFENNPTGGQRVYNGMTGQWETTQPPATQNQGFRLPQINLPDINFQKAGEMIDRFNDSQTDRR